MLCLSSAAGPTRVDLVVATEQMLCRTRSLFGISAWKWHLRFCADGSNKSRSCWSKVRDFGLGIEDVVLLDFK